MFTPEQKALLEGKLDKAAGQVQSAVGKVKDDARNWRQSVLAEMYKPAAAFFSR